MFRESLEPVQNFYRYFFTFYLCYGLEHARYMTGPNTWTSLIGNEHKELCDKTGDVRFVILKCGLSKFRPLRHDRRCICSTGSVTE